MKNILVTGAGAVLGQGILRCLQEYANDFIIHTADPDHKSSGHWLGNKAHIVKMANDPEYINSIENIIQTEKIDIIFIIVDYLMPKMTGAELIREIKAKHPNLKCVMLSGHANPISIEALNKENMLESFISKPWNEEELFDTIRPILEGYTR